jgi:predicted DNA-binding transcriptional regulator YafY
VNNDLYLVGFDHAKKDVRVFAVERIQAVEISKRRFETPADFDFEAFRATAFSMIWGEPKEVKIWFSNTQAPYIEERTWHPSQKLEKQDDGSVILTLSVADEGEVKRWLTGFGAEASVLHPDRLRDEIRQEWEAGLAALQESSVANSKL